MVVVYFLFEVYRLSLTDHPFFSPVFLFHVFSLFLSSEKLHLIFERLRRLTVLYHYHNQFMIVTIIIITP